ncbi:hypothetical protein niasHT_032324 [Heterodera trifolii]|uniref:G-protein coupled receptors family 1 profile domain-containing protein n=1 Tax=Heterodera trifolii TaxID=157864 RepID=A0ABD2HR57_9BILA
MTFQNYSMVNEAFNRFGVGTFSMELFLTHFFRWLVSLPGMLFNAALLNTIIREKSVHGTCATLLAIGSAADFVFLLLFSVPLAISLSGQNMISNFGCFFLQCLPNLGLFSSVWIVFFVGIDRLISVLFPFWYNLLEKHLCIYIFPMLTVAFGYSTYVLIETAQFSLFVYPDWPVLCTNGDIFGFGIATMLVRNGMAINGGTFLCYFFVGLTLFRYRKKNPNAMLKHRIFKTLAAIMALVVGTYFAICLISVLFASVVDPFFNFHILSLIIALLAITAASSNGLILYIFSSEYRQAFRKHLKGWPLIGLYLGQTDQQIPIKAVSIVVNYNNAIHHQPPVVGRIERGGGGGGGEGTKAQKPMPMARVGA